MLDTSTLTATLVVVRYTVNGNEPLYKLYVRNHNTRTYGADRNHNPLTDTTLDDHLDMWEYHSHQEVYL